MRVETPTTPDALGALVEIEAIKQLKARHCRLLDRRDWSAWRALLTDEARNIAPDGTERAGADALVREAQLALDGTVSVHQAHMPEIELTGEASARGVWSATEFVQPADGSPGGYRRYARHDEEYRKEHGAWKIVLHAIHRYLEDPPPAAAPGWLASNVEFDPLWLEGLAPPSADQLVDLEAIRQLKARYCRYLDTKEWDRLRALFAPDARFEVPALPEGTGPNGLVDVFESRHGTSRTAHQGHLPEIRLSREGTARGIWALHDAVAHAPGGHQSHSGFGHYQEEYRLDGGEWRIARFRLSYLRSDPAPADAVVPAGRRFVNREWLDDSALPDEARLDDLEELHKLKARYFRCIDTKDHTGLRSVCADEAVRSDEVDLDPLKAGRDVMANDTVTVHHGHMPELRMTSATTARGYWSINEHVEWTHQTPEHPGFVGFGHHQDEYRREHDGWKISSLCLGRLKLEPPSGADRLAPERAQDLPGPSPPE